MRLMASYGEGDGFMFTLHLPNEGKILFFLHFFPGCDVGLAKAILKPDALS